MLADGFVIVHHRAFGSTCYFGPFVTIERAHEWLAEHKDVRGLIVPVYLTVDWSR